MTAGAMGSEGRYLGAGEVARLLDVSPQTVGRWAAKGLIPCVVTLGGHRRFRKTAIEQIRRNMDSGRPPPADDGPP